MNGFYWESDWKGRLVLPDWQMHDRYWVWQTREKLIEAGAVEALPRRGREAIHYLMTGTARLAF